MAKRNPFAALAHGHDLAEAIVDSIREPLLVLDPGLRVLVASRSFYALAAEKLLGEKGKVECGRLYFCTSAGGFAEHTVPLEERAREAAQNVATIIGAAIAVMSANDPKRTFPRMSS